MSGPNPNLCGEAAAGKISESTDQGDLPPVPDPVVVQGSTLIEEPLIFDAEFVMWEAAIAEVPYLRAMQAHNI